MPSTKTASQPAVSLPSVKWNALHGLVFAIAIAMPIASGFIYPTYVHYMVTPWVEWTRLQELPFVAFEFAVCWIAARSGLNPRRMVAEFDANIRSALILLLGGIWIGSIFISHRPLDSIAMSIITVLHFFFALSVVHLLRTHSALRVDSIMPLLAAGVGLLIVFTAWRFLTPPPADTVPGGVIEWMSALPGFISGRHLGAWTGAIAAGSAIEILWGESAKKLSRNHLFFLLCTTVTVWTATRAAMLAMVVTALIALVALRRFPTWRAIAWAGLLTALAFLIALPLTPAESSFQLIAAGDYQSADSATAGRTTLWAMTFWRWLDSPLLGWGTGSTFWEVYAGWTHTQPHNAVLQFLISWGLLGALPALYLLARAIGRVHGPAMSDPQLRPLLAVLYGLLFQSLLEGMLHYPRFIEAILFLFAVIIVATTPLYQSCRIAQAG